MTTTTIADVSADDLIDEALIEAATSDDPEVCADAAAQAARSEASAPVLRAVYEALAAQGRADLGALGHLLNAGMPYTHDEAMYWVQVYPTLAHTISVTTECPSRELSRLLRMAGIPMMRWQDPSPTVRSLDPADL